MHNRYTLLITNLQTSFYLASQIVTNTALKNLGTEVSFKVTVLGTFQQESIGFVCEMVSLHSYCSLSTANKEKEDLSMVLSVTKDSGKQPILTSSSKQPISSSSSDPRKTYHCKLCTYSTSHTSNMSRHTSSIHEKNRYSCDSCAKSYSSNYDLMEHVRSSHQNTSLLCEVCSKLFSNRKSLSQHRMREHTQTQLKYTCQYCSKTMDNKEHYRGHINSHLHTKPYSCTTCKKSFTYKASLNRHGLTCKSGNMDITIYKCQQCNKVFSSSSSLSDHKKGKHGFKDLICKCGKTFSWRSALTRHKGNCKIRD